MVCRNNILRELLPILNWRKSQKRRISMKRFVLFLVVLFVLPILSWSHCEIPCGIYDDEARYDMLKEHIVTMKISMTKINTLSMDDEKNYNQIVRWVTNKENHAEKFMHIVSQYFLNQRLKPISAESGDRREASASRSQARSSGRELSNSIGRPVPGWRKARRRAWRAGRSNRESSSRASRRRGEGSRRMPPLRPP